MTTLTDLVAQHGVTLEFVELHDAGPALKITYQKRSVTVPYSFTGQAPTEVQIFNCILSDACTYENARSYVDWCMEYDFDPDEKTSRKAYEAIAEQTVWLKDIFGDNFDLFVYSE